MQFSSRATNMPNKGKAAPPQPHARRAIPDANLLLLGKLLQLLTERLGAPSAWDTICRAWMSDNLDSRLTVIGRWWKFANHEDAMGGDLRFAEYCEDVRVLPEKL